MSKPNIMLSKGHYIDGKWVQGTGALAESINPSNATLLWQGNSATEEEVSRAFFAASQVSSTWASTSFEKRVESIQKFGQQVEKNTEQLALLISMETGKPLWESQNEVKTLINKIEISIQAYKERTWPHQAPGTNANSSLRFKPHGVVVILGSFNFPAHISNSHIIPALLAGNTILYKPSELTPAVAEQFMNYWHDCALPDGVINCLQGGADVGTKLLQQDIKGVFFTGSYPTGLRIHQYFSARPDVVLALEMGGNNPLVIDEIDDINAAVYNIILSSMITSGQRCTCARRVMIPNNHQGDELLSRFLTACTLLKVGSYDEYPEPFMGPVISQQHALYHLQAQKRLLTAGGESLLSMRMLDPSTGFLSPGVIDMTQVSIPPDEEVFAPLVQIYRYDTFEQALHRANQTRYGLSAGIFTNNKDNYDKFYNSIQAGLINWNRPTTGASSNLPFGGVGLSGNNRPSAYFAADYCSYPVASLEKELLALPEQLLPGIDLE